MPESAQVTERKLISDMGQKWTSNWDKTEHYDQFGFKIFKCGNKFHLYRKNEKIGEVNKLHSAKFLSRIWLNDAILYSKQPDSAPGA